MDGQAAVGCASRESPKTGAWSSAPSAEFERAWKAADCYPRRAWNDGAHPANAHRDVRARGLLCVREELRYNGRTGG